MFSSAISLHLHLQNTRCMRYTPAYHNFECTLGTTRARHCNARKATLLQFTQPSYVRSWHRSCFDTHAQCSQHENLDSPKSNGMISSRSASTSRLFYRLSCQPPCRRQIDGCFTPVTNTRRRCGPGRPSPTISKLAQCADARCSQGLDRRSGRKKLATRRVETCRMPKHAVDRSVRPSLSSSSGIEAFKHSIVC